MPDEERDEVVADEVEDTTESQEKEESISKEEFEKLKQEKADLEKRLEVEKEKERNFKALDTKAKKSEEEKNEYASRIEALEQQVNASREAEAQAALARKEELINNAAKEDKDLRDKIEFFYGRTSSDLSPEERASYAISLAKGGSFQQSNSLNRGIAATGSSSAQNTKESDDFSESEGGKQMAKALGLKFINKQQ